MREYKMKWWIIGAVLALFVIWNILKPLIFPAILFGLGWFGYQYWKKK